MPLRYSNIRKRWKSLGDTSRGLESHTGTTIQSTLPVQLVIQHQRTPGLTNRS